ncbi:hypothetical protein QQS21_010746, partial [Conoideocrella luteorostrata]
SYTACRPAELVDGTKSRGVRDPMLDDPDDKDPNSETFAECNRTVRLPIEAQQTPLSKTVVPEDLSITSKLEPSDLLFPGGDDTSDPENDAECNHDESAENFSNNVEMFGIGATLPRTGGGGTEEEDGEAIRRHKALCYEDVVLWIVQDPNQGDRDVLAIEVFF